jgi:hypothetical protein
MLESQRADTADCRFLLGAIDEAERACLERGLKDVSGYGGRTGQALGYEPLALADFAEEAWAAFEGFSAAGAEWESGRALITIVVTVGPSCVMLQGINR